MRKQWHLLSRSTTKVRSVVSSCTVGLFAANMNALTQQGDIFLVTDVPISDFGSGVLLTPDDNVGFLITAAHVLKQFQHENRRLHIDFGTIERPLPLDAHAGCSAINEDDDVGVVCLTTDHVRYMAEHGASFLNPAAIMGDADLAGWYCMLSGQLAEGSAYSTDLQTISRRQYDLWTKEYSGSISNPSFSAGRHLLVTQTETNWTLADGLAQPGPISLGGMSGGSLWRVFNEEHLDEPRNINVLQSAGIQTQVYDATGANAVRCTKWNCVIPLIHELYPEAVNAFLPNS